MDLNSVYIQNLLNSTCENTTIFSFENLKFLGKVVSVHDGDTCNINFYFNDKLTQYTFRMLGYDSPEVRTTCEIEKKFGLISKNILEQLVLDKIVLVHCGNFDKYGRILTKLYVKTKNDDEICINDFMINNHLGVEYNGKKTKICFNQLYQEGYYKDNQNVDIPSIKNFNEKIG